MRRTLRPTLAGLLFAALVTGGTPAALAGTAGAISPGNQSYTIDAVWNQAKHALKGTETVSFTNLLPTALQTIYLRTWPNGQRTGSRPCSAPYVTIAAVQGGSIGHFLPGQDPGDCTAVPIDLPTPLATGQSGQVTVGFKDLVHGPEWNFRYGISGSATFMSNAFPILAVSDPYGTHLEPYNIKGESMYSIVASWDVTLTVPAGLQVPSTGEVTNTAYLPGGSKELTISAPAVRDFALAIGTFDVSEVKHGALTIRYFSQPGTKIASADVLGWAVEAVDAYTAWYGPLDATELDMAEGTWTNNGFENPDFIMICATPGIVHHEVAHEWWYSMVGNNQYGSPWVDESFATFSTHRLNGTNVGWNVTSPWRWNFGNIPLDTDMSAFPRGTRWNYWSVVYYGGGHVLEALRRTWGDAPFDQFMRYLQTTYHDGVVTTCDVENAIGMFAPPGFAVDDFLQYARIRPGVGTAC